MLRVTQSIFTSSPSLSTFVRRVTLDILRPPKWGVISRAFFLVWRRWGKNEERKGTSLMILALLSYRGGIGVANWIRRYTCFKIETRISFSRIIIKEGARRRVFKLISNKWKIRNKGRRKDMCFHRVPPNFYYSDNSSVPILGWDRASTFFLINRDESFEGTM